MTGTVIEMHRERMCVEVILDGIEEVIEKPVDRPYACGDGISIYDDEFYFSYEEVGWPEAYLEEASRND